MLYAMLCWGYSCAEVKS